MDESSDQDIKTVEQLEALYEHGPGIFIQRIELDRILSGYRAMIEASTLAIISTSGPGGLDTSPRGGEPGFVKVIDEKTLYLPDYKGNNRLDSMRNLLTDSRIGMIFFVPGFHETLRVHGTATISADPQKLGLFEKPPRSLLKIHVDSVFLQCGKAPLRSGLIEAQPSGRDQNPVQRELKELLDSIRKQLGKE